MKSETIGKLAEALAKAQMQIKGASKDALNPHFRSKYADLESVWDACREALGVNGLSVVQTIHCQDKVYSLRTTLMHLSGEWMAGEMPLLLSKQDMQGLGASITYGRRFSLMAMCGIAPSEDLPERDDDGETAVGRGRPSMKVVPPAPPARDPVFEEIKAQYKTLTHNFQDKVKLQYLVASFGTSDHIKSLPPDKQRQILENLRDMDISDNAK